jgi:hypothetical protein
VGMLFVELVEGRLFVELVKAVGDWLWCSDRIGNRPELDLDCLDNSTMGGKKGKMENTSCEMKAIALCGSLLLLMIAGRVAWSLGPFFFWTQERWDYLLCVGQFHYLGTCSTEV